MTKLQCFFLVFFISISSYSQELIEYSIGFEKIKASEALTKIEQVYNIKFSYAAELINEKYITLENSKRTLDDVLFEIAPQIHVDFNKLDNTYMYLTKSDSQNIEEVLINSYLTKGITKNIDATFNINPKKLDLLAGLTETDVLESIQQLPGVVSIDETATGLSVRGGTSDQNQVVWDNISIYHTGHLFGMVSVFNPNVAQNITFYNKGTNAKFGERIASVIDISTSTKIPKKISAEFGINGINADVYVQLPIIKDILSIQTSFRRSYEDFYETKTFRNFEAKAFQNTKIVDEQFYFKDYNLKLNFKPNKNNHFSFSLIHIDNDLEDNTNNRENDKNYSDVLDSENDGYNLQWNTQWNSTLSQKTSLSLSNYRFFYNFKTFDNTTFVSSFTKTNTIQHFQLATETKIQLNTAKSIEIGYQNSTKNVNFLFKEKDAILYILDSDDSDLTTHSIYSNYTYKTPKFSLYAGLRASYYQQLNSFRIAPRVILNKPVSKYLSFQFTAEIKNQAITQIDETVLSDLTLESKLWRLADGEKFPIVNSSQFSSGLTYSKNKWTADFDLYYKKTEGITALSLGFLNPLDNNFHRGKQKTWGVDFYLKRNFKKLKTWISYSFLDVKNKYGGLNNNTYFTSNTEIRHSLSTSMSYKHKQLQFALGWKWRTGKPLTDLDYDINGTAYFDGINTETIKSYHRLDLSSTYTFKFSKNGTTKGKVGISIRNIYDNKNHISTDFKGNNSLNDPIEIITNHAIGITPNFMFRVYW